MVSEKNSSHDPPKALVLDHQKVAFEKLVAVATACFSMQRKLLPVRPRTNSLIIGPSGSGKTFLAKAVADAVGAKFMSISTADWILLGAGNKGAVNTWPAIVKFLYENRSSPGVVIFLDEIDKLSGLSGWEMFLRSEIYVCLDLMIPSGLMDDDSEFSCGELAAARDVLANRTMIIAAGAFQNIWEDRAKPSLGFGSHIKCEAAPSLSALAPFIPRELGNRFRVI